MTLRTTGVLAEICCPWEHGVLAVALSRSPMLICRSDMGMAEVMMSPSMSVLTPRSTFHHAGELGEPSCVWEQDPAVMPELPLTARLAGSLPVVLDWTAGLPCARSAPVCSNRCY